MNYLYHSVVAVRKGTGKKVTGKSASGSVPTGRKKSTPGKKNKKPYSWALFFWLGFTVFIFGFFILNRDAIIRGYRILRNEFSVHSPAANERPVPLPTANPVELESSGILSEPPVAPVSPPRTEPTRQTSQPVTETAAPQIAPSHTEPPNSQSRPVEYPQAVQSQEEVRERALYFSQVDRTGSILRVMVNRKLPVSDSPLTDTLNALLSGPNDEEKNRGLITLIPGNTRILSALVRGATAYISLTEDFQYNSYGVEGYAGQLRQIIYTATEFSNVNDVQILIEGRLVNYLGEGIWIGSPLNREML